MLRQYLADEERAANECSESESRDSGAAHQGYLSAAADHIPCRTPVATSDGISRGRYNQAACATRVGRRSVLVGTQALWGPNKDGYDAIEWVARQP
jgi:hypothetical protein